MYGIAVSVQNDDEAFVAKTERYLKVYAEKIIREENLNNNNFPTLSYSLTDGTVKEVINHLIDHHQIDLIVMGLSGAGEIKRFMPMEVILNIWQNVSHTTISITRRV